MALTRGRTRRELAESLGVRLSTLQWRIGRLRDREIDFPDKGRMEDAAEELKRLRRENASSCRNTIYCSVPPLFRQEVKSMRFAFIDQAKEQFNSGDELKQWNGLGWP